MPARVIDPKRVYELLAMGLTPHQVADAYHVRVAAVYQAMKENPHLSASAMSSQAWLRRPLCSGDWREFVNVEDENDPESE